MNELELFEYTGHEVRVQVDESGEPLFVLADLAAALGIANVTQLRARLADDLCLAYPMRDRLGRAQQVWVVTEPGLYEVIIRSDKPEAAAFRRWVTGEVLPSIRRHGVYATESAVDAMLADPETMIRTLTALRDERAARVRAEAVAAEAVAEVEAQRPHAQRCCLRASRAWDRTGFAGGSALPGTSTGVAGRWCRPRGRSRRVCLKPRRCRCLVVVCVCRPGYSRRGRSVLCVSCLLSGRWRRDRAALPGLRC